MAKNLGVTFYCTMQIMCMNLQIVTTCKTQQVNNINQLFVIITLKVQQNENKSKYPRGLIWP